MDRFRMFELSMVAVLGFFFLALSVYFIVIVGVLFEAVASGIFGVWVLLLLAYRFYRHRRDLAYQRKEAAIWEQELDLIERCRLRMESENNPSLRN